MRRIKDNRNVPVKRLSREQADSLLNHILDDIHLKTDVEAVKRKRNFRKIVVRRHIPVSYTHLDVYKRQT